MQKALIVIVWPVCGVLLLGVSVHEGTGAPPCQFTATLETPPVPVALLPDTE